MLLLVPPSLSPAGLPTGPLTAAGHRVAAWTRGPRALAGVPDDAVLVVDLATEPHTGVAYAHEARTARAGLPVLAVAGDDAWPLLTAAAPVTAVLDAGAGAAEWTARLRLLARPARPVVPLAPGLVLDTAAGRVRAAGASAGAGVALTPGESAALAVLAARPGTVVSREALHLAGPRGDRPPDARLRSVDVLVSRLRRKLGPDVAVEAVLRRGYRLSVGTDGQGLRAS